MKSFKLFSRSKNDPWSLDALSMVLPIVFCTVCGVLLIAFGNLALRITAYTLGATMILLGAWLIIAYVRSDRMERITESKLAIGLILLVSGLLLVFSPDALKELLPFVWGLALLFGGFLKIQYAFDEKTVGVEKWWIMLVFAGFSILIGVISLLRPAFMGESTNLVVGILMVAEAVLDLTVFFLLKHALRKFIAEAAPAHEAAPAESASPAGVDQPAGTEGKPAEPALQPEAKPAAPAPAPEAKPDEQK